MVKRVVGKINKEMSQNSPEAHVNSNDKTDNGAGRTRTVSAPRTQGLGAVYKEDDEDF